jgi:hypothetical protein
VAGDRGAANPVDRAGDRSGRNLTAAGKEVEDRAARRVGQRVEGVLSRAAQWSSLS